LYIRSHIISLFDRCVLWTVETSCLHFSHSLTSNTVTPVTSHQSPVTASPRSQDPATGRAGTRHGKRGRFRRKPFVRVATLIARGSYYSSFEMSQYVTRATGIATKALDVAKTRVVPPAVEWYNATMAKNAQYVVKDPEAVNKLGKQLVYSNLAKLPTAVEAAQGEIKVVQQKWANRMDLPMSEVRASLWLPSTPSSSRVERHFFSQSRCWQTSVP